MYYNSYNMLIFCGNDKLRAKYTYWYTRSSLVLSDSAFYKLNIQRVLMCVQLLNIEYKTALGPSSFNSYISFSLAEFIFYISH